MKKVLILAGLFSLMSGVYAQEVEEVEETKSTKTEITVTYVEKAAKIAKFHNQAELEKMGKLELTKLYIERVTVLSETLPYLALSRDPAGANLSDLGIPETKTNVTDLEKEVKSTTVYVGGIDHTLTDVIPYADKGNIIWSILFMEETLNKIERSSNN
jgi:hypothetical protein